MQHNFRKFEEIVFCNLWFPDSGFRIPVSDSGFRFPGFRVALKSHHLYYFNLPTQFPNYSLSFLNCVMNSEVLPGHNLKPLQQKRHCLEFHDGKV